MDIAEWIGGAIAIVIGAYIVYVIIQTFCETNPGFCEYGWLLMGAYIAGAVLFLKYGLGRKN